MGAGSCHSLIMQGAQRDGVGGSGFTFRLPGRYSEEGGRSPQADLEGLTVLFLSFKKIMSPKDGAVSVPVCNQCGVDSTRSQFKDRLPLEGEKKLSFLGYFLP